MKATQRIFYILFFISLLSSPAFATIEYKTVQSNGTGGTLKEAITEALSQAIGRVNGLSLDSKSELNAVAASVTDNNNTKLFLSEKYKKSIKEATKGVVSSYSVIDQSQVGDGSGTWEVTLSVKVAKYIPAKRGNRKRIAVMPLRVSSRNFLIENRPVNKTNTNRIFGQNLVSSLVQSRRFTVLDREYIKETLGERKLIVDGHTPVQEMARLGQDLVADYILTGTLEDVNFKTSKVIMQSSGRELTSRKGKVEVSYRIIDVDTKQIAFSDFARLRIKESDIRKVDSSVGTENMASVLCMIAAEKIGKKILNVIYPILVVSVRGQEVVLGQGGDGVKRGDRYDVFEYGKRIIDPYTKEFIGREEIYAATIEVTRINPKQSYAKIIKSERDMAKSFKPKKLVCRIPQDTEDEANARRKKREEEREKKKKERDNDW
jgi:hypothetical protein